MPRSRSRRAPGIDVGVMVELRDHDRVTVSERSSQRPGQVERERGHIGTEGDLTRRGVEEIREGLPGDRQCSVGLDAGRECPVGIGIMVDEVVRDRIHHGVGDLSPARAVEIGHGIALVQPLERGEVLANRRGRCDRKPRRVVVGLSHEEASGVVLRVSWGFLRLPAPRSGIIDLTERG